MSRSLARTAVLAALTATLAAGGATAAVGAVVVPVPGTAECTNLVNVQADVQAAQQAVANDQTALNTALRANPVVDETVAALRAKLATDQANLANVVVNVTRSLCPGTVRTTTPAPTTEPAPQTTSPRVAETPRTVVVPPFVVPAPTGTTTTTVIPTQDDGSVAQTSGSQVSEVPSGSAQTGAL